MARENVLVKDVVKKTLMMVNILARRNSYSYKFKSGVDIFQMANVLFLEAPACVGFSYDSKNDCATGDDETSLSNYLALQDFFTNKVGLP